MTAVRGSKVFKGSNSTYVEGFLIFVLAILIL